MSGDLIFYVYEHWRPDKDVCFYVGKGKADRASAMYGRNVRHSRVVDKLRRLGLSVRIVIHAGGLSEAEAHALEIERIAYWRAGSGTLVNVTDGGEGASGLRHTPEARAKISAGGIGRKRSEETKKRIADSNAAHRQDPEYRERQRQRALARWADPEFAEKTRAALCAAAKIPRQRAPCSEETRRKIGESNKLRWDRIGRKPKVVRKPRVKTEKVKRPRAEFIEQLRALGHKNKEMFMAYASLGPVAQARAVVCVSDGRVCDSASAAARHYGVSKSALTELCLGKNGRKTVGGLVFSYEDAA